MAKRKKNAADPFPLISYEEADASVAVEESAPSVEAAAEPEGIPVELLAPEVEEPVPAPASVTVPAVKEEKRGKQGKRGKKGKKLAQPVVATPAALPVDRSFVLKIALALGG